MTKKVNNKTIKRKITKSKKKTMKRNNKKRRKTMKRNNRINNKQNGGKIPVRAIKGFSGKASNIFKNPQNKEIFKDASKAYSDHVEQEQQRKEEEGGSSCNIM